MKITPTHLTLNQLFSSGNEQFVIPAYQRRFAWRFKQCMELFEDIEFLNSNDTHLLGQLVILTESHKAGLNKVEVVDGQQRLTTLILLLKAIQNTFDDLRERETSREIDRLLYCKGLDNRVINKVFLGDLDNPDYEIIMSGENFDEIKNQRLLDAYENNFKFWLKDFSLNELREFYFKLLNNIVVIRLDVADAKDAYKLFETINNRGLKLSPTDIIKNFILGHASKIDENTLRKARKNWQELIINLDGIKTDDFFRHFIAGILNRKVSKSDLIEEFKRYYINVIREAQILSEYKLYKMNKEVDNNDDSEEDEEKSFGFENDYISNSRIYKSRISIIKFTKQLQDSAECYSKIINRTFESKSINSHIYNLQRIQSLPSYAFLLNFLQRNISDNTKIELLRCIEAFMLRRHVCEYRTSDLDEYFPKLCELSDTNLIAKTKSYLKDFFPKDVEFINKFRTHNYKGKADRAKYVLEQIEYYLIKDHGEYSINSGNEVHLEHIIPQTIKTKKAKKVFGDWVKYLGRDSVFKHKEYLNNIGNLTILADELNIIVSNNPFKSKQNEYKKSNITLNRILSKKYTEFKFRNVIERASYFSKLSSKIWNL